LLKVFLDSSAVVKRYVSEPGSSSVDYVIDKGLSGESFLATSIWNIGEVLGVLDTRLRRGWLDEDEFKRALEYFSNEILRLVRLRILEVFPVLTSMLVETWPMILSKHIYEADGLQIQTSIYSGSDVLLSGDRRLIGVASKVGLKAVNVENESVVKGLFK